MVREKPPAGLYAYLSEMRGRAARRFLGEMTLPGRPGESLLYLFFLAIILNSAKCAGAPRAGFRVISPLLEDPGNPYCSS